MRIASLKSAIAPWCLLLFPSLSLCRKAQHCELRSIDPESIPIYSHLFNQTS
ncbi:MULTISPECIES: hypothetical protein [Pseudanabaena]|uniref:Uncharacterized protein n=1 Tax=Pseudanabaena catenata USMAC16 TaxID=1855837 RepID=A0A9X4RH58_9CYAN|nr:MULTISPECIES: hypothetical protein [Pseudanabaena]MDG3494146.1 hypothetical protein [Pseudanabaena catenata USMAC16]